MIAFLSGTIEYLSTDTVIVDVGGIGYEVKISAEVSGALSAVGTGNAVKLYTYTYLREDQIALYGFLSRDDLALFKQLITVSGIGPKGGLSLLSVMSADDLRFAILSGDARMISRAPGVGKKTAERVILDLREKVAGMRDAQMLAFASGDADTDAIAGISGSAGAVKTGMDAAAAEAVEALTALGYSRSEAAKAVRACKENAQEESVDLTDTESILKAALRFL